MVASSLGRRPKLIAVLNPSEVLFISSLNIGDRGDFCLDLKPPPTPPPPPTHPPKNPAQPLGLGGGGRTRPEVVQILSEIPIYFKLTVDIH
jgi:hypothetical protein